MPLSSPLHIVIVGAGIGGLSAAICLARKGHHVRVLESSKTLSEYGAGIQITPNATRILHSWDLRSALEEYALTPDMSMARRYQTGVVLGTTHQNPQSEETYGFPYWQIYRPDFQRILAEAVTNIGVSIEFDCRVIDMNDMAGSVTLEDGKRLTGDLIICCDGIRSQTRPLFEDNKSIIPKPFNEYTYRAMIKSEDMMKDPETAVFMNSNTQAWLGPGRAIIAYPISRGSLFNLAVIVPNKDETAPIGRFNSSGDIDEFRSLFADFCPSARKIVGLVNECAKWTIAEVPSLPVWSSARSVLLGDSAHAMSPHAAQGAAMAIEDAAVLGECLSDVSQGRNLTQVLRLYETIRRPRVERIAQIARDNATLWVLADGREQEARDNRFRSVTAAFDLKHQLPRSKHSPDADMHASWPSPQLLMWIYGFDAIKDAQGTISMLHKQRSDCLRCNEASWSP